MVIMRPSLRLPQYWIIYIWVLTLNFVGRTGADQCGFPGSPANGSVVVEDKSGRASYTCDPGFVLFGDLHRNCLSNHTWSGEVPTCDLNVAGGKRASQSDTFFNYTADQAVDGRLDTCSFTPRNTERRWWQVQLGATYTVAAVAVTIGPGVEHKFSVFVVSAESGGKLSYELCGSFEGIFESETIVLVCNQGRGQTGQLIFVRDDRDAFEYFGFCEVEVFRRRDTHLCGKPETPLHVKTTFISPREIEYDCMEGHRLEGVAKHTCVEGRWKGPTPVCHEVACEVPEQIDGGIIHVYATENRFVPNTVANYSCEPGFLLEGNGSRVCTQNGSWSGQTPICVAVDCGLPPSVPQGLVQVNSTLWGSVGVVICNEGFHHPPDAHVYCSQSKRWILVNASCYDALAPLGTDVGDSDVNVNSTDFSSSSWNQQKRERHVGFMSGVMGVVVGSIVAVVVTLMGIAMIAYLRKRWILNLIKSSNNDVTKNGIHQNAAHSHSNLVDDPIYDDISYANNCFHVEQPTPDDPPLPQLRIYDQPADDEPIYYTPVEVSSNRHSAPPRTLDIGAGTSDNPVYEVLDAKGLDSAIYAQVDLEKKKKDREESFRRRQKSASAIDLNPDSGVYENVMVQGGCARGDSQGSVLRPLPPIPSESSLIVTLEAMDNGELLDNSDLYNTVAPDEQPEDDAKWEKSDSIYAALDLGT